MVDENGTARTVKTAPPPDYHLEPYVSRTQTKFGAAAAEPDRAKVAAELTKLGRSLEGIEARPQEELRKRVIKEIIETEEKEIRRAKAAAAAAKGVPLADPKDRQRAELKMDAASVAERAAAHKRRSQDAIVNMARTGDVRQDFILWPTNNRLRASQRRGLTGLTRNMAYAGRVVGVGDLMGAGIRVWGQQKEGTPDLSPLYMRHPAEENIDASDNRGRLVWSVLSPDLRAVEFRLRNYSRNQLDTACTLRKAWIRITTDFEAGRERWKRDEPYTIENIVQQPYGNPDGGGDEDPNLFPRETALRWRQLRAAVEAWSCQDLDAGLRANIKAEAKEPGYSRDLARLVTEAEREIRRVRTRTLDMHLKDQDRVWRTIRRFVGVAATVWEGPPDYDQSALHRNLMAQGGPEQTAKTGLPEAEHICTQVRNDLCRRLLDFEYKVGVRWTRDDPLASAVPANLLANTEFWTPPASGLGEERDGWDPPDAASSGPAGLVGGPYKILDFRRFELGLGLSAAEAQREAELAAQAEQRRRDAAANSKGATVEEELGRNSQDAAASQQPGSGSQLGTSRGDAVEAEERALTAAEGEIAEDSRAVAALMAQGGEAAAAQVAAILAQVAGGAGGGAQGAGAGGNA